MANLIPHSISALVILALAHVPAPVLAQSTPSSSTSPPTEPAPTSATATTTDASTAEPTSETTATTATTATTTVASSAPTVDPSATTPTAVTITPTPSTTVTTTDVVPTTTTAPTTTIPTTTRSWNPTSNHSTITHTTTAAPLPTKGDNGSSSSSSTNVPVIVGTVVGIIALAVIVATSIICYRRRRRNNRDLTFDALTGMSGPSQSSKTRAGSGAIGLNSMTSGGYDEAYDYEMQSNSGYPAEPNAAYGYNNGGYDGYATSSPHQGYLASPTIFQEDHYAPMVAPFATASSMGRTRDGFDQNLPEVMYNGGMEDPTAAAVTAGYYNESDMYDQSGWHQDTRQAEGYIGPQGLRVANPGNQYHHHQNAAHAEVDYQGYASADPIPTSQYQERTMPVAMTLDTSRAGSPSKSSDHHSSNAHTLPDSPIIQSSALRGGDLFGQDSETNVGSPNSAAMEMGSSSSPKVANARDPRSIEHSRLSPTSRPSVEGGSSYANDYMSHSSVDGRDSRPTSPSNLNPNKTLRTLRPDDWS
ncbi:hypothetical protein BG011_005118 [Mortierella polycephala]|uniref:Uncharacterized protein n=1 Tax=Mortierella polycephala TaxID=41804 RepID=A0A9P6PWC3_9FUNG|nr:hypothetical protein BG011_005118 [Mortierella polycephala]